MKRRAGILARSMILTFLLTLLLGSLVVHAQEEAGEAKEVSINYTKYTVNLGDEDDVLQLKMENSGDKKPRWISYNVNVARVDQDGVVTPLRKGKAIISSGIGFPRKTCVVTVVDPSVKLNKTAATLYRSDNENTPGNKITLTAKVNGATKDAKNVVWSSSNTSVAKVEKDNTGKGVVTADQEGTAVITARVNGRTASCKVTVLESTISLNVDKMQLSTKGAGSSIKLVPTVVGSKKAVTWTSSDTKVATVKGGKVTGKKAGTATVTATANGVKTECTVTVVDQQISISEENVLLYVTKNASGETTGETKELKTNAAKTDEITWTSSNEEVVTVEPQTKNKGKEKVGKLTAVGAGTATITATCNGKTDTCVVEVKNTSTSIAEKVVHLKTKGAAKTYTLGYQVTGRSNKVTWKSKNAKIVSVSKGKVTAKKAGTAIVTMTANGVTDEVQVIVQDYTPTIALNQKEYTLYTKGSGNNITLKATVSGTSKKIQWQSNNASVAEVNAKGKVTAKGKGRALIMATANGVTAKCWVNVKEPMIILEKNALVIKPGQKVNLCDYASIEVIGAKQSVTYKSSNTKAATVNAKGLVTGKKAGEAEITIKANGVEEKCEVVVSGCETHTFGAPETLRKATCEENGLISKICTECGGKEQEVTPPLGHFFGKWTVVAWSTENAAGLERQVCIRCKEENTRIIPAKNKGDLAYGYKLEWEDDFNGTELDRNNWNVELHEPGWVNDEWQEYVDSEKNIYVKDGNLVIQAIKDGNEYTSGRVNTKGKKDYQYGRFEARAKVPSGKGFLPAFWMMPTDEMYYGQWPKCGEIDVMEVMGQETDKVYSTLHFGEPHTQKQGTYTLAEGEADFSEDFHVYACEWDPDEFRFYVDDKLFYKVNDWFTKKPGFGETAYPAPYDQPFYMILNLAVGGSWVTYPDETTEFGDNAQLVVDYVRVYQKDEYDTDVSKTETDVQLRDPDDDGNYIINGDFAEVEDLSGAEGEQVNWKLHLEAKGAATAEIKDEVLHINPKEIGAVNYHVQIVQADLPIEKGSSYKLTYDAWADEARTMVTAVKAPDRGYICYMDETTVNLTKEPQSFEHTFEMTSNSDANGRVEFNLGKQGSTDAVHIDNVKLKKLGAVEEEEDSRSVLPDGNYVYNGAFNEGNAPGKLRLDYWDWKAGKGVSISVPNDKRELTVVVPETVSALEDVVVYQKPITIKGGKKYVLSFDAHADQAKTIKTTIAGETFESALTTEKTEYKYEFNTAEGLDGSELRFLLGAAGTTYIDNVSIKEDGLLVNGDFSSGMVGYEVFVDKSASVSSYVVDSLKEKDAFSIDITDTGDAAWKIQLKQSNIKLEKDKWYKISFDAKAPTMDRKIMYALQRDGTNDDIWTPYSGEHVIDLSNEYQNFSHTFKMASDTDPKTILSISMGAVGGTQITEKHTVVIDNIILEETDPVEIPPVEEGEEMIANGDFSEGDAHWENAVTAPGAAEVSFDDGKATYKITNVGEQDWHIQLKHKDALTLEKGAEYAVKFNIKSTEARTVKYAFLDPTNSHDWYGGEDLSLTANDERKVEYTLKVSKATCNTINFVISMGVIAGEDTPISTIEIDDISVKKIGGTEPVDPSVNLIKNGDFAAGDANWVNSTYDDGKADVSFDDGKATYVITDVGTEDSHVQLKQEGLTLVKGAEYAVKFNIKSTEARTVRSALLDPENGYDWYGGQDVKLSANEEKEVAYSFTVGEDKATSKTIAFAISMGKIDKETIPTHTIEIDDVSLVKVSGSGDDPSDDPVKIGTELIVNGDFAAGKGTWGDYIHTDGGAIATTAFGDSKARYEITNVGEDDWNVQLKQTGLKMEKDATYKVSFKIGASIDRDVRLVFLNGDNQECAAESISLTKDKVKSVSRVVTLNSNYTSGTLAFQLSMGKVGDTELAAHAIEISNISVKKVAAGTTADTETEEDVTIAAPGGSGKDPEDPDQPDVPIEGNMIENGYFSEGETGWTKEIGGTAKATVDFSKGKAVYTITNVGSNDWDIKLKHTKQLTLEKGAKYKVKFNIESSAARTVKSSFMYNDSVYYGGNDPILAANVAQDVAYEFTVTEESSEEIVFAISMGKIDGEDTPISTIKIDNVSVVKVGGTGGEEPDDQDAENLIKNGNFAKGDANWVKSIWGKGAAEASFEGGKATYKITNVGEEDSQVQLKQESLTLEKGAAYKVSFKIKSSVARTVKSAIMNHIKGDAEDGSKDIYDWYNGADVALTADTEETVTYDVVVGEKETSNTIQFVISMGQMFEGEEGSKTPIDTPVSTIEISDIKLIKVKDGTGTEDKNDPETETLAPVSISDDDTDDGSGAVVEEEEDDQDPEDQDDKSDDPADDEDANPADQDKSDEQTEGGDAEASDDNSNAQASEN